MKIDCKFCTWRCSDLILLITSLKYWAVSSYRFRNFIHYIWHGWFTYWRRKIRNRERFVTLSRSIEICIRWWWSSCYVRYIRVARCYHKTPWMMGLEIVGDCRYIITFYDWLLYSKRTMNLNMIYSFYLLNFLWCYLCLRFRVLWKRGIHIRISSNMTRTTSWYLLKS